MEASFEKVDGVKEVISGYSGGNLPTPTYPRSRTYSLIRTRTHAHPSTPTRTYTRTRTRYSGAPACHEWCPTSKFRRARLLSHTHTPLRPVEAEYIWQAELWSPAAAPALPRSKWQAELWSSACARVSRVHDSTKSWLVGELAKRATLVKANNNLEPEYIWHMPYEIYF